MSLVETIGSAKPFEAMTLASAYFGSDTPKPGMYPGIPASAYHALDLASAHRLATFASRSPAHVREEFENPDEPTEAIAFGRALHSLVLEPQSFEDEYVVSRRCSAIKKTDNRPCDNDGKYRVGGQWLCGTHIKKDRFKPIFEIVTSGLIADGFELVDESDFSSRYFKHADGRQVRVADHRANERTTRWMYRNSVEEIRVDLPPHGNDDPRQIISQGDHDRLRAMRDNIESHDMAARLIRCPMLEATGIFCDVESGTLCKFRPDMFDGARKIIADLKTVEDASPAGFVRAVKRFGYHFNAAFYLRGSANTGNPIEDFAFIAAEKDPPYGVAVYRLSARDEQLAKANTRIGDLLMQWRICEQAGAWPCYSPGILDLTLNDWDWERIS